MAYDTTTQVTDDLDDNLASYHNQLKTAVDHLMSSTAYAAYTRTQSMTGNVTLTDSDFPMQSFSPTAARDLTLPTVASTNHAFYVINRGSFTITIKNSGGSTVYSLLSSQNVVLLSDGSNGWYSSAVEYTGLEGSMKNGRISVTVVANDLVLAIKTIANADPSSSDPVKIVIGGTERTVTAATSCTLADATNWFNSGGAELATKLVGYFAYAIWDSNSSVVAIAPARVPYGRLVSDFSSTNTNELYLGNYANYTSTDNVANIGYFEATLSAGAGYTWTVPTFTNTNLKQQPTFQSNWLPWAIVYTGFSADPTSSSYYKVIDDQVFIHRDVSGNGTSNATTFTMTFPFKFAVASAIYSWVATTDNGAASSTPGHLQAVTGGSNVGSLYKTFYQGVWTGSGAKNVYLLDFNYRIR